MKFKSNFNNLIENLSAKLTWPMTKK